MLPQSHRLRHVGIGLALAVMLFHSTGWTAAASTSVRLTVFADKEPAITLQLPVGWTTKEGKDGKIVVVPTGVAVNMQIWNVPGAKTVADAIPLVPGIIKGDVTDFKVVETIDIVIAGTPGKHLIGTGTEADDGDSSKAEVFLFTAGGKVFLFCVHGEDTITAQQRADILALLATAKAQPVLAAAAEKKSPAELPETVVTATRIEETPGSVSQDTAVVTQKKLRERQPAQVSDALRDEPGVWMQKTGVNGGTPIIRGFMGNEVLYMVDGIRINNGQTFSGPNSYLNSVDVGSMQQIEVLKGPGSVQYGSDAMGGIVNMIPRTLDEFPDKLTLGGRAVTQYSTADKGTYNHGELSLAGKEFNILAGGSYLNKNDYRSGSGDVLENTGMEAVSGMVRAQYKVCEGQILTLGFLDDRRNDMERYDQSRVNASGIPKNFAPWDERRILYLKDQMDFDSGPFSRLVPYVYYQDYRGLSQTTSESATTITMDKQLQTQRMYGTGIQAVSPVSDSLRLIYGADARYETADQSTARSVTTKANGKVVQSVPQGATPGGSYDVEDAFLMAEWDVTDKTKITLGTRFETSHISSEPKATDPSAGFTQEDLTLNERWCAETYSLGVLHKLTDKLSLASNLATGFRAPGYADTLRFGAFTNGVNVPSPGVQPEKSITFDIGPRYECDRFKVKAAYFHTWLTNAIISEPAGGYVDLNGNGVKDVREDAYAKTNGGNARINGVELSGEYKIIDPLTTFGSICWMESRNQETGEVFGSIPPLNGTVGLRYQPSPKSWWVETYVRMADCQDRFPASSMTDTARATDPAVTFPSAGNPPLRSDYSIPSYTTLNFRAGVPLNKSLTLFANLENATDNKYREAFSRQDAVGINLTLGMEATF